MAATKNAKNSGHYPLGHFNIENVEMLCKDLLSKFLPRDARKANLFRR
jgi:hypothetical protein